MNKSLSLTALVPLFAACCLGQSVASVALSSGSPSHASANITFSYTGSPTFFRFRIAVAPAMCTSGTGGNIVGSTSSIYTMRANPQQANVNGLSPSTTYQVCPEITPDGSNWYGGVGVTFTTLAQPSPHPVLPVNPVPFNTSYPNTNGFTTYNLNTSCIDTASGNTLQQDLNQALSNQVKNGSIINIAAGAVCRGQFSLTQHAADTVPVTSSAVCTTTATGCTPNSINISHNFVEGDIAVFGSSYGAPPPPILQGQNYFVHVLDATHFQLTFPLPYSMGGSIVPLTSQGAGTWYYYRRFNVTPGQSYGQRALNWIIIRPSTPDSQFVPEHTRLQGPLDSTGHPTPPMNWLPKMYTLTMANQYLGFAASNQLFTLSNQDGNDESMNGYIRIVGAHFTFDPSQDASGGQPVPHYGLLTSSQWNSDIVVDRSWFDPPPHPDKNSGLVHLSGTNMAKIDSYSDNFDYYHPMVRGMALSSSCLGQSGCGQLTIAPGTYSFGSGSATLPSTVTVNFSGAQSGTNYGWLYFDAASNLYIALPPGFSGSSCTGYTNCRLFTLGNSGGTAYYSGVSETPGTPQFPNTSDSALGDAWAIEPVVSMSSSCGATSSLFPTAWYTSQFPNGTHSNGATTTVGTRFYPDTALYFCGWRTYIPASDGTTSHTFTLWSDTGTNLAHQTLSGAQSGQNVFIPVSAPITLTAGSYYRTSIQSSGNFALLSSAFENFDPNGGLSNAVHASQYVPSNGAYNYSDSWAKTFNGRPAVAIFSVIGLGSNGLGGITGVDTYTDGYNTEGCQCEMAPYSGPGPLVYQDNYTVGSGNITHFDDAGGYALSRHDFTIRRNWWYAPLNYMFTADGGNSASDGMRHGHRHSLEWKQGNCGAIVGNIFDTGWVEDTPFGDLFEISGQNGGPGICGITNQPVYGSATDFDIRSNTFMHASSVNSVFGVTPGSPPTFPQRFRLTNNVMTDISGTTYCALGAGFCSSYSFGSGLILQITQTEDFTISHNTLVGNNAGSRLPFILLTSIDNQEGFNIRDNILWINGVANGLDGTSNDTCGYTNGTDSGCWGTGTYCKSLAGISAFNCAYINSSWVNNLMTGSPTQSQIKSLWPNNVVPPNPSNLSSIGWFNYTSPSVLGNYNLRSNSPYISGGANPASDGLNIGVNYDQLQIDQGYVTLNGVSNITTSSAEVTFVAPDGQACPIDYSPSDPTVTDNSLVRVADTGTARTRNVSLTGLSTQQIYYFRVNCAVNQPMGQFKTH